MPDLSVLRSEIKAWERKFKAEHGRDPSIQDIKDLPAIAEKYKLYKKLSKAATSTETKSAPTHPPSTPPRPQQSDIRASLLLSKPRVVETTAPFSTYNPFSPIKGKGKQKDPSRGQNFATHSHSNLFSTPSKGKVRIASRDPSPDDDLPAILPFQPVAGTSTQIVPPAQNAVSRARKRLRGEPVSPSPNKGKRRRTGSQSILPFAKLGSSAPVSDGEDSDLDDNIEPNLSFVHDSPVKAPAGGRPFKLLFDEAVPNNDIIPERKGLLSRSKSSSASVGLFGYRNDRTASTDSTAKQDKKQDHDSHVQFRAKGNRRGNSDFGKEDLARKLTGQEGVFSGDGVSDTFQQSKNTDAELQKHPPVSENEGRRSAKRSLADIEAHAGDGHQSTTSVVPSLLPPSPPPNLSRGISSNYKRKGVSAPGGRKRAKILEEVEDDESDSPDEIQVKVVTRNGYSMSKDDADIDDPDLMLDYGSHRAPRDPNTLPAEHDDATLYETGEIKVDLPDTLRRVLAISPSKVRDSKEELVVRGLLSGKRATHYDGARGGEIWDVGEEDDEIRADTEGEDDWEGEPVPWEVGEL